MFKKIIFIFTMMLVSSICTIAPDWSEVSAQSFNRSIPQIYINPTVKTVGVNETFTLQVMVNSGETDVTGVQVNGAQINAQLDPNYLKIVDIQNNISQLSSVLDPISFDVSTGSFLYSAGVVNGTTISKPFVVLDLTLKAVAPTAGTTIKFLNDFPPTDISGPTGSVMESSQDGTIIIERQSQNTATLFGEIGLQGRPIGPHQSKSVPVAIKLQTTNSSTSFNIMLDQNGRFTKTGILSDIYDVHMVNSHTLASKAQNVVLHNGDNTLYLGPLMEGDTIQDNEIRVADFGLLSDAYNLCRTNARFEEQTDLNEDSCTDIDDFSLLSGNYNVQGDIEYDIKSPPPLPLQLNSAEIDLQIENIVNKAVGDVFDVLISVDPKNNNVNGATAHIVFDPEMLEVLSVDMLAEVQLPVLLQKSQIDNDSGTVLFSKGVLGSTVSQRFDLAKLSVRLKQKNDGTSLTFSDDFPATNVTGTQGSVLARKRRVVEDDPPFIPYSGYLPWFSQ